MGRLLSMRLALIAVGSFGGIAACTSILGDFEVRATDGANDGGLADSIDIDVVSDANVTDVPDVVRPQGFAGAKQVTAGARHTCVIANSGEVFCWGDNSVGQIGQAASGGRQLKPKKVMIGAMAKTIAAGANFTCVITASDDIICWGENSTGQTGTGNTVSPAQPHVVRANGSPAPRQWALVAPGVDHTCAVDQSGQTYCWGANDAKQAGTKAATDNQALPFNAGAEKGPFSAIAASDKHTCGAVVGAGGASSNARCWGTETRGALGNGPPAAESSDQALSVATATEVKQLALGAEHSCALDATGDARCWGDNRVGQLGVIGPPALDAPGTKIGMQAIAQIAAGGDTTCGIAALNRTLACLGSNSNGQLGRGGTKDNAIHADPQPVLRTGGTPLEGVVQVSAGRDHVCAIVGQAGEVFCWGNGADGQLGDGTSGGDARTTPVAVALAE